jgi:hypothetical protein
MSAERLTGNYKLEKVGSSATNKEVCYLEEVQN